MLLVGSASSFFTIFPVITALGLKVLQLDRAGALEPGCEQLQLAAAAAAETADCVLVTEQQLQGALFPLNRQAFFSSTWQACWMGTLLGTCPYRVQAMHADCAHDGTTLPVQVSGADFL